ncbi:dTDP-4-dehydrorhamnose 3,5-epimerase family protein [Streptomyces sp. CBMA152]|uniref:dTDP-4-dehydrorhamnose 3,5-epimerase family protein n=1 Tax=Streptomyces sp. CBMA152 TaxID=1896312 RepID=UPI001660BF1F|nr:dTDP-4-dehydrorhamnose 3,5-epimerase family protein [Streptomyces sp. CBMA152]MBD0741759.1 dTDP-4-dehydrorhamnose 3,5-epimerase [Streptomyces sp. CBMA152]
MKPLSIEGAWLYEPTLHTDERGTFLETFRNADFQLDTGRRLELAQVNHSVSRRGVIRGVHFADVPPGQAKYVTCVRGAVRDVIVDLRTGSPTYRAWEAVELDDRDHRAVFLSEGLGHAFQAVTDDAAVIYLTTSGYDPGREHGIDPLDPDLGIAWLPGVAPLLSAKDAAAPTLAAAEAAGLLPAYEDCVRHVSSLATPPSEETP